MLKLILLIEDTPTDELLARKALAQTGIPHQIVLVTDGQQGMDWLFGEGEFAGRDITVQPDLILSNFKLPKFDAPEIVRAVRADRRTRAIPYIVMSSSTEKEDGERALEAGADVYIPKPVRFSGFVDAIREHVVGRLTFHHG
jgi:two-component system response regulator